VGVCCQTHCITYLALDSGKIADVAIVHNSIDSECERVVVCWRYGRSCCSPNMGEDHLARGVAADGTEICIVKGRLNGFVEGRVKIGSTCRCWGERGECICVPCHSEAINVEEAVSCGDLCPSGVFRVIRWRVGQEHGKIMLVNLFAQGVGRSLKMLEEFVSGGG
jgi:hypothetical protein